MSLEGANLFLCSCNGTMPLDREALARALELAGAPAVRTMLCQKELAAFAGQCIRRRGRRVHAGGQALRRCRGRGGARADDPLRQHPRNGGMVGRSRRCDAEDRRAAGARGPARSGAGATRHLPVAGPVADRRTGGGGALLGRCARGAARGHGPPDRSDGRRRVAGAAQLSGPLRQGRGARRLARRIRRRLGAGKSDRPRSVHALQRVHQGVPRARDRLELPDRPRPLQGASPVRGSVRRDGRDRFRAR